MNTALVDWTGRPLVATKRPPLAQPKRYQGGDPSNLLADWITPTLTADQAILPYLPRLRNRCRSLERDNSYVRRFLTLLRVYVFGWRGIKLESSAHFLRRKDRTNTRLNDVIKEEWAEYGELGNYDVTGKFTCNSGDKFALRRWVIDGEIFIRLIRNFDNPWRFAVEFIEADAIDHDFYGKLPNGNVIRGGIEFNQWNRPVRYYVTDANTHERVPVEAADMIHVGIFERTPQSRCVPLIVSAILNLRQFGEYEHSEIVTARVCSSKMGMIERSPESVPYTGATEDEMGNLVSEIAPGVIELLDPGQKFVPFDPGQPKGEFGNFRKAFLRGIACAFDVGYNALASDLEGVNYSSLRHGQKDDVEVYRDIQYWFIALVRKRIFKAWLEMATLAGRIDAPGYGFDQIPEVLKTVYHKPRGFAYVDPTKDAQADLLQIANKMETRTNVLARRGEDIEEVFETLADEEELADEYGIDLTPVGIGGGGPRLGGGGAGGGSDAGGTGEPPAQPRSQNGNNGNGALIVSEHQWLNPDYKNGSRFRKSYRFNTGA